MTIIPPALIIAYKRDQNVIDLVETLVFAGVSKIYVAIDGLKDSDISSSTTELSSRLRGLKSVGSIHLKIWERKSNLGPAVSVITAIDWFFANEESGIILEDDLKITADSVNFFADALVSFKKDKSVGIISGSNYWGEIGTQYSLPFANYPITWGWATWKDRWDYLKKPFYQNSKINLSSFPLIERMFWRTGVQRCMNRTLDAWDIPFAATFKSHNLKAVVPHQNFVTNIGFDEHAGNTFLNVWPLNTPIVEKGYGGGGLRISASGDITESIIQDIYKINFRSVLIRPVRSIQHFCNFRKSNALRDAINLVFIPNS